MSITSNFSLPRNFCLKITCMCTIHVLQIPENRHRTLPVESDSLVHLNFNYVIMIFPTDIYYREFQDCSTNNSYVIYIFKMKIQTFLGVDSSYPHKLLSGWDGDVIIISGLLVGSR